MTRSTLLLISSAVVLLLATTAFALTTYNHALKSGLADVNVTGRAGYRCGIVPVNASTAAISVVATRGPASGVVCLDGLVRNVGLSVMNLGIENLTVYNSARVPVFNTNFAFTGDTTGLSPGGSWETVAFWNTTETASASGSYRVVLTLPYQAGTSAQSLESASQLLQINATG